MRSMPLEYVRSCLGTAVLVTALGFQMLPFFLLLVAASFAMGVSSGGMLIIFPVFFFRLGLCLVVAGRETHPARPRPCAFQDTAHHNQTRTESGCVNEDPRRAVPGFKRRPGAGLALSHCPP